jgi:type I restriction enzyme S subunit
LRVEHILREKNAPELRQFGNFVASAFYPAATHLYEIGDTPFIRCVDCVRYPLITKEQDNSFEKIPLTFVNEQSGVNTLNKGDIVITKVGTPSYPSMVYEHELVALSRTVLGLKDIRDINKYYLLVFLRSKYGFSQLQRHRELTIQYQLTLERTKRTLVFVPSDNFQNLTETIVHKFIEGINKAKTLYAKAESILLEECGFFNYKLSKSPYNFKNLKDSFGSTKRLDAEYYQVKYEQIVEIIRNQKHDVLQKIASISKSIEPGSNNYTEDDGLPFYRVSDYNKFGLSKPDKELTNSFVADNKELIEKLKPKKGTILFSKDGSVGTAYLLRDDLDGITSGAILHLKVKKSKEILPEYLTLALNSKLVQMQAERDSGGSIILHWRKEEIEQVVVPIIDFTKQKQIAELIEESFKLKIESERLFEIAKKSVEIAIETDEKTAIKFINDNT